MKEKQKQEIIKNAIQKYEEFLDALQLDWRNDTNLKDTPKRVVKSYVNELMSGLFSNEPEITDFENENNYDGIVFQSADVKSICAHHFLPFIGKAYVAYIPGSRIIGLSKLNRIVEYFSRRPQVQENLTMQIHDYINKKIPNNKGVAVYIEATHLCATIRGVEHESKMKTCKLSGAFFENVHTKEEFFRYISYK